MPFDLINGRPVTHERIQIPSQNRPDGMKRVVPAEPLVLKPSERLDHDRLAQCELVLDNRVDGRVQPHIREPNSPKPGLAVNSRSPVTWTTTRVRHCYNSKQVGGEAVDQKVRKTSQHELAQVRINWRAKLRVL